MSTSSTSTNTPYAGVSTSSSPTPPHDYIPTQSTLAPEKHDTGFTTKEVLIFGGGLVLTAVITYFSTLISVNADISNNRENISVIKSDVTHLQNDMVSAESDIAKNEAISSKVGILEVKVIGMEKQLDAHIGAANEKEGITK
jgi:hypothetical protein